MTRHRSHRSGIRDWSAKQALLRALYDVLNNKALVQEIVLGWVPLENTYEMKETVEKCYETFRRWDRSTPAGPRSKQFWQTIIRDRSVSVGMAQLWSSSIVQFVEFFKDELGIEAAVGELVADARAGLDNEARRQLTTMFMHVPEPDGQPDAKVLLEEYNLRGHLRMTFEGPQTGVENGRIQSTMFYNVPEAAKAWADLVDSENYDMYLECLLSLKELVGAKHWRNAIKAGEYDAAVTLGGGGSPEKDWILATSLLEALDQRRQLEYWMNDISPYMIQHSVRFLNRRLVKNGLDGRIRISYDWSDFLKLDELFRRPPARAMVWALLGGTIGNVSERDFFRSLRGPSRVGDLLVVGVDTFNRESVQEFEQRMSEEYRSTELDVLLCAPIQSAMSKSEGNGPVVDVTVQAYKDGDSANLSDVTNSRTAVFSVPAIGASNGRTVLAHSTRYLLTDFIAYAHQFGWEHLGTTSAPSDSTFRQLLLRRSN